MNPVKFSKIVNEISYIAMMHIKFSGSTTTHFGVYSMYVLS